MESEEKYIEERFGRQQAFRVPEGYFDQLTARVMSQLPAEKQKTKTVSMRRWWYAAACIALVAVMGTTYYFHQDVAEQPLSASVENGVDNAYIDDAADYAMIDNAEIYACLADN